MATNVLLVVVLVIRFSIPSGSVVSQPIVMKLFTHINDNILHPATVGDFSFRPYLISNNYFFGQIPRKHTVLYTRANIA